MDFQSFVDGVDMPAAVMSVENTPDNHCGDIYIVCANTPYKKSAPDTYHDNILYTDLIPKEPNFEDFCYRCAVQKKFLHSYAEVKAMHLWTETSYIPIAATGESSNTYYLLVCIETTIQAESDRRATVSMESASFIIQACINLRGSKNFSESIQKVVSDIQERTEAFSSCIFLIDSTRKKATPLSAKYRNDEARIEDFAEYLTYDVVSSWIDTVGDHDEIILKDDFDMAELEKRNPVWVKSLRGAKVTSMIFVPLTQGETIIGFLFITNFNTERLVEIKEFIELTAFFISSELANNNMVERLAYLSSIDTLTGVNNRNSMNARIDYHVSGKQKIRTPFGIIFADLNGLKACNDQGGHEAGDRLLQDAAAILKKECDGYEVYRAGGDEFVVIMPAIEKTAFEEAVARIRSASTYGKPVCFAIGSSWSNNSTSLRRCMHLADEAMYADKQAFYSEHHDYQKSMFKKN